MPSSLLAVARTLLALPGLSALRPLARRVQAVAEPAGRLHLRPAPSTLAPGRCQALTVLSANLWHDWPRQRRLHARLEAVARLIESERADLVLLQEVTRRPGLRADEWLAGLLGMASVYSRANGHESAIGFEEGLAVLSRFPLAAPQLRHLGSGTNPFVRRLGMGALARTPCGELLVFCVHLGLRRSHNAAQLRALRAWVAGTAGRRSAVIGGDFNAGERSAQILHAQRTWLDTFRHLHPTADGTTHELRCPRGQALRRSRLDYIFLRPGQHAFRMLEARHVDAPGGPHSDHRAVLARVEVTLASP